MKKLIMVGLMLAISMAVSRPSAAAVDWTAINPAMEGATSVKELTDCLECHEDYMKSFEKTRHAKYFKATDSGEGIVCEKCHGPMSKHLAEAESLLTSEKEPTVVSFEKISHHQKNQICMKCHESGLRMHWSGSAHEMSGVSCSSCHYVMEKKSAKSLFISEDPKKACTNCHKEKRAQLMRSSHMPLREGKMDCASCHNPHGGPGPSLLKTASVNEACYECHADKRGPFLWEHAPVRENCSNCHDPHGSNNEALLKIKNPYLCQSCHSASGHPSTLYDGSKLPGGSGGASAQLVGRGCLNCHSLIHGSNHPSGAKFQR